MDDFIIFMHSDAKQTDSNAAAWERYIGTLRKSGRFSGGSAIGEGVCVSGSRQEKAITAHISGYIRVQADSIEDAKLLLVGNPVLDGGGTVEIRRLLRE